MENKKYQWIQKSYAKGIDPDAAVLELERIETELGSLTAENVLKASESETALLHSLFNWDDTSAAHQYRLSQARTILNNVEIKIVSEGQERIIPVYEVVTRSEGRVYKHIEDFSSEDVVQVKNGVVKALNYWKNKLSVYREFDSVIARITELVQEIEK